MEKIKVVWSIKSECGPIRKKNEDSVFPDISGSGFAPFKAGVFDGMGGHKKGEVASQLAASVMKEDYKDLVSYVEKANKAIYEYQETNKDSEGMGTTMTAIEVDEEYLKKKLQEGISAETLVSEVLLQEPKDNITAIIINII